MLLTILLSLAAVSCSRDKKPDFRDVKWGMTKDEVKKHESAELVKEGNEILTYRLGGDSAPVLVEGDVQVDVEGKPDARVTVEVEKEEPAYDLVYVFGNGKLSMAIVHLRDTLADPAEYLEAFKQKSREISKETGETASGVAEYGESEPKDDPYSDPGEICEGKYVLKHVWPTVRERTDVTLELDRRKFSPEPDCNLAVFYESADHPVDAGLFDELHDLL